MKTKKAREKRKFWAQLIEHIDSTWRKRKGVDMGYPFTGKDMADLRHFCSPFKEWGLMALWDQYMAQDNEFNRKTGWSVFHFTRQLPFLVDAPEWKSAAHRYEMSLAGPYPENLMDLFDPSQFRNSK